MSTRSLRRTTIQAGDSNKHVLVNESDGRIEEAISAVAAIDLTAGNVDLSSSAPNQIIFASAYLFRCSGHTVARDLTIPTIYTGNADTVRRLFMVHNLGTAAITVKYAAGTTVVVAAGVKATIYGDGTNMELVAAGETGGLPLDVVAYVPGTITANQILMRYLFVRPASIVTNALGSAGRVVVAPAAQWDLDLRKNGVSFGTMRFAAAALTATFPAVTATTFAIADYLDVVAPATPDAAALGLSVALKLVRTG